MLLAPVIKCFLWNVAKNFVQLKINGRCIVLPIKNNKPAIAGHCAQNFAVYLFSFTNFLKFTDILRTDQQAIPLLILSHIDFQDRHGGVADLDFSDINPAAGFFHQLFQDISRPAGSLVVDNRNERFFTHLNTGADDTVHLLFHFRITSLYCIEVEVLYVVSLEHTGCCSAAKTHPVGRPADLDNKHVSFCLGLFRMSVINLANASSKHDRFQKAPAFSVRKTHIK